MSERPLHLRVAEIERLARESPERYRARVRAWTRLGVAAYAALLLVALAVLTLPIWLYLLSGKTTGYLVIPGAAATYALLAALFTRGDRTEGAIPIGPAQAPELWREVERLAHTLRSPMPSLLAIDLSYEAGLFRHARFALWGRGHTVLRLGVAMIVSCDENELRAMVAQTLGHHRAGHGGADLQAVRFGNALLAASERLERGPGAVNGLAWLLVGPLASRYLPELELLLVPQRRLDVEEAYGATLESGLAWAARRRLLRATVLGPWYEIAFFGHRPEFAALRRTMEGPVERSALVAAIGAALRKPEDPRATHPPLATALELLGERTGPGDEARLADEAAGAVERPAWEAFIPPDLREDLADWFDFALGGKPPAFLSEEPSEDEEDGEEDGEDRAAEASDLLDRQKDAPPEPPPTPLEAARRLAAERGTGPAAAEFAAVAADPRLGIVARYDAAATLSALDPHSDASRGAWGGLIDDPYFGANARSALLAILNDAYDTGRDADPRPRDEARAAALAHHKATRAILAALHREPQRTVRLAQGIPPDVLAALGTWVPTVSGARRAWALWAAHPRTGTTAWPLVVIDVGLVTGGFRMTLDSPKQVSFLAECAYGGPTGAPAFAGRDPKEIAAIVGDLAPFWTA